MIEGEAKVKRLSMRSTSGLVVTKYALNGWTIKGIDRATGEEIYYNTKLPTGEGSWASEEQAYKAIGDKIAGEFSRDFFLPHVYVSGRKVMLKVDGLPRAVRTRRCAASWWDAAVITVGPPARRAPTNCKLAGSGPAGDIVAAGILKPLNAKLGQSCFSLGAIAGDQVAVVFDAECNDPAVLGSSTPIRPRRSTARRRRGRRRWSRIPIR